MHACVDCGQPALDWSLRHDAYPTYEDSDGRYALQVSSYEPRCRSCHTRYDGKVASLGTLARFGEANGFYGHKHSEESKRRGERNGQAKLTDDDVREIRRRVAAGALQKDVAAMFGVQKMQVSRIVRGERWSHVTA